MNTLITDLTWWQTALVVIYALYTLGRAIWIFNSGLKEAVLGTSKDIKLYHILWSVIDIPAIILGTLFPLIKKIFSIPVIPLKRNQ